MTKVEREIKRAFGSVPAQISAMALRILRPEWCLEPVSLHHEIVALWQSALTFWESELREPDPPPTPWPEGRWARMRRCHSSLVWTPSLVRTSKRKVSARFCGVKWLCPFCYGREIVKFLRPFEHRRFSICSEVEWTEDPAAVWSKCESLNATMTARHGALANWRYVGLPSTVTGTPIVPVRTVWLYPGGGTLVDQMGELAEALAYPIGILESSLYHVIPFLDFMKTRRGRIWTGHYRNSKKRDN